MDPQVIHIAGPGGAPYRLGQPMLMFAGRLFLGRVDPVHVGHRGTEVYFGSFVPTSVSRDEPRNIGALLFYEACAHVARFHPQVQLIRFTSSRPMPGVGDPAFQAAARVAALERIGAANIVVTPLQSGLISVSGTWAYNERNLRALELALDEHRVIFRTIAVGRSREWPFWLGRRLRRMLLGTRRA
jgi:hypothetical protein